ncbi:TetR/AcrR family transcriptional regulator [Bordetella genomosp. 5]|uniref:TetR family transcriptional regulator n=1 Tax=Bordetella genomosp. 5 TaxID=1395608 RepID=A0A261THK2_9BORD|nr:TetR/AcrR family transcriptional regulator [Bordetella genomosp. 5]OZI49109.1 TetR family transcriptional regulator [Bordetella genomosp. 5]
MGRKRTIDRDKVLDAAEAIVAREGAAGLTIDAVAREMGVTKGGIQYCYGSKDALIDALFERFGKGYETLFADIAGTSPGALERIAGHVGATHGSDALSNAKAAGLMATLIQSPEHLASTQAWYRSRIDGLDLTTEAGRRARLAFLATEGAFMLRFFNLLPMDATDWDAAFEDIRSLLPAPPARKR